jgi:hypothetical protein
MVGVVHAFPNQLPKAAMNLTERLARYGITEREDGTLVEPAGGSSLQREIRTVGHAAMTRLALPDGSELPDGRSTWRPVDRKTLLWWISQGNPIADWLLARGVDPAGVV